MNKQTGATMIEVLITILILAIGLLGLSATQMMSLKNGNNAHNRYMAALAAHEMAERLRANSDGLELASYDGQTADGTETSVDCSVKCSPTNLARLDLYEWGQVISTNLPGGVGLIERDGRQVTLSVTWDEQNTGQNRSSAESGTEKSTFKMVVEL
ncbi:type IV pilus modification protein PilV [Microbulbifer sp. SA54]|uniref:type IV pilus modification protein PilV n=1 Tax=Microbulbifer sp. SA54 TaxID=3401577 RepID=UPI003AB0B08C